MYQEVSEVERRLAELQSQIDRLTMSLHLWREGQDELKPMEQRLSQLTAQCAEIVERWGVTGGRHAQVVSEMEQRLGDWNAAETRVAQDASARIQDLQRIIEHEWSALRQIHEEPVRQLREQASSLTEVCVTTATTALSGFERAEARLAGLRRIFIAGSATCRTRCGPRSLSFGCATAASRRPCRPNRRRGPSTASCVFTTSFADPATRTMAPKVPWAPSRDLPCLPVPPDSRKE